MCQYNIRMSILIISIVAMSLYLITAGWIGYRVLKLNLAVEGFQNLAYVLGGGALSLHAIVLYQNLNTGTGLNLGFYHALSLMSWVVALFVIIVAIVKPVANLAIIFLPAASLNMLLELIYPNDHI